MKICAGVYAVEHPQALCLSVFNRHICSKSYHFESFSRPDVTLKTTAKANKLDAGTGNIKGENISVRYVGGLWMTFNEELQGQISACLQRTYICIIYTNHRMI